MTRALAGTYRPTTATVDQAEQLHLEEWILRQVTRGSAATEREREREIGGGRGANVTRQRFQYPAPSIQMTI